MFYYWVTTLLTKSSNFGRCRQGIDRKSSTSYSSPSTCDTLRNQPGNLHRSPDLGGQVNTYKRPFLRGEHRYQVNFDAQIPRIPRFRAVKTDHSVHFPQFFFKDLPRVFLCHPIPRSARSAMDFSQSAEELLTKLDTYREQLAQVEEASDWWLKGQTPPFVRLKICGIPPKWPFEYGKWRIRAALFSDKPTWGWFFPHVV